MVVHCETGFSKIDFINGKRTEKLFVAFNEDLGNCLVTIFNCKGIVTKKTELDLIGQSYHFDIPPSGLITIDKIKIV